MPPRLLILCCLLPALGHAAAQPEVFDFTASYRGLLSAGAEVGIADARLVIHPPPAPGTGLRAEVALSSQPHEMAELLYPMRFCYQSWLDPQAPVTRGAEWWSRAGGRESREALWLDRDTRGVRRFRMDWKRPGRALPLLADLQAREPVRGDEDLEETLTTAPPGIGPTDRLAMVIWLRGQDLRTGLELAPAVTNGRQLRGYRILVEDEEDLDWEGTRRPAWRIRLEPRVDDASETAPTRLWLSRDAERLPLKMRSERALGAFELRLLPGTRPAPLDCAAGPAWERAGTAAAH